MKVMLLDAKDDAFREGNARRAMNSKPLAEPELDRLDDLLARFSGQDGMNLEQLDGFFAALICGPSNVLPSEYLPEILRNGIDDHDAISTQELLQELISLVTRHWNTICDTLRSGAVFTPLLLEDAHGVVHANDWASGFMRGMGLRMEEWVPFLKDEDHASRLVPIFALAHEHDPDPAMRPYKTSIGAEMRERLIVGVAAGVTSIYRYFEEQRSSRTRSQIDPSTFRRTMPKIGRNDPCPCGSGKKFKQCCGKIVFH
jgi:uncharacterized protein